MTIVTNPSPTGDEPDNIIANAANSTSQQIIPTAMEHQQTVNASSQTAPQTTTTSVTTNGLTTNIVSVVSELVSDQSAKADISVTASVAENVNLLVPVQEVSDKETASPLILPSCAQREAEPDFPHVELGKLDEMINRQRWVVPVLPGNELEVLLDASIDLCRRGLDTKSEACQRFFREGLTISFTKVLTDDAVSGWKTEIHKCILKNSEKLVELCVLKLDQDWFPLLDLLAIVFNPNCKFHSFNANKLPERLMSELDEEVFAKPFSDQRPQRGWLVDLINLFGSLDGFKILLERFNSNLSIPVVAALIRPFGICAEMLTVSTLEKYFMPIVEKITLYLDNLTDDELKREAKMEAKNDTLSNIINSLKCVVARLPNQEEKVKSLEMFRLQIIFRLLQISSFNGKMNALNEINKLITSISYNINKHSQSDCDDWLTPEKIAEWLGNNDVLSIVLRDSLHQPQYVEKLEKIVRFMIKEKALNLQDLDRIWEAQTGKHEAIVKNVHDLLAKLAWDFTPLQLDHLFECFQASWGHASKKQREKLLELIRRLAEDDKEGIMANKVLVLLWSLAQSEDVSTDIMDQALVAHIKILDYSCSQVSSQDRDTQKMTWVAKFVEELKKDRMVLPALKQIREICQLFTEAPPTHSHLQRPQTNYRNKVISYLHNQFTIVKLVSDSLEVYMDRARKYAKEHPDEDPSKIFPDGRFNHHQQVNDRLKFLRFLLKDGQLWLCKPQANQIWTTLAENAVYPMDRENCFKWYSKLMGDEPDLDPEITKEFFQQYILKFDPALLTESGMICFERFFRFINLKDGKFYPKRRGGYFMENLNLLGVEYLWRVVSYSPDEVAEKGILLLKDVYTNLGAQLQAKQVEIHEDFLQDCLNRLKAMYDTVKALQKFDSTNKQQPSKQLSPTQQNHISQSPKSSQEQLDEDQQQQQMRQHEQQIQQEANRMIRILTVLKVYIVECDEAYCEERAILPLVRACRGKQVNLIIRCPNQGRPIDDIELWSHTNETIGNVRRQLASRMKGNNFKVELCLNGDVIDPCNDRKLVSQLGAHDKIQLTVKYLQVGTHNPSSPDSSSGSSIGSMHNIYEGPNIEAENCLPGVLLAHKLMYTNFLFNLADLGCQLDVPMLRDCAREILKFMPADSNAVERLIKICKEHVNRHPLEKPIIIAPDLEALFFGPGPSQVLYYLDVMHSILVPATSNSANVTWNFQKNFLLSGGVPLCLKIISSDDFLQNSDPTTKRSCYLTCLKILKLIMPAVGYGYIQMVSDAMQNNTTNLVALTPTMHAHAVLLQKAFMNIPNPNENIIKSWSLKLGQELSLKITGVLPNEVVLKALQRIIWSCFNEPSSLTSSPSSLLVKLSESDWKVAGDGSVYGNYDMDYQDADEVNLCHESLELLTVCIVLCQESVDVICKDKAWQTFIISLLLGCKNRSIRIMASDQFYQVATNVTSSNNKLVIYFITLLFTLLSDNAAMLSPEYFNLLCRLLNYTCEFGIPLNQAEALLNQEIVWLKRLRVRD
ncbi:hypothetical protein HELRODRAFT_176291 [Helobdella robusta]|uniref:USP domain-containing protein n=1 Tax=Helobdella robusta TaxID=6412 RepID=T1FAD4_HELRO|nr:hypothetical protein HELRODRAFT_176291 [Helobdella robusta]ESN99989.1 hypothetical protein HELRODRAFT_176291 [Helobdella robusta]